MYSITNSVKIVSESDTRGDIMKLYESETVELKEIYTPDFKKEIVAFANTNGGIIYIGVQDNGEIVGLDNAEFLMQEIANSLRDGIRPDVSMFTNIELLQEDNKYFVKLMVSQGKKSLTTYLIKDLNQQVYMLEVEQHLPQHLKMLFV